VLIAENAMRRYGHPRAGRLDFRLGGIVGGISDLSGSLAPKTAVAR
jgi:hypothetical protein